MKFTLDDHLTFSSWLYIIIFHEVIKKLYQPNSPNHILFIILVLYSSKSILFHKYREEEFFTILQSQKMMSVPRFWKGIYDIQCILNNLIKLFSHVVLFTKYVNSTIVKSSSNTTFSLWANARIPMGKYGKPRTIRTKNKQYTGIGEQVVETKKIIEDKDLVII